MTPAEKFKEEMGEVKLARMNRILQSAFNLFSEKGIDTIAMTDIAKAAEIGVASLYRYYSTKDEIAIQTAIWIWEKEKKAMVERISDKAFSDKKGLNQIEDIFNLFIELFQTESPFFRFIYFFDSFAVRTQITADRLIEYEAIIMSVQKIIEESIKKGISDGSINKDFENIVNEIYFSLMHTFFSTAQKLSLSGNLLRMDQIHSGCNELKTLSQLLIKGLM